MTQATRARLKGNLQGDESYEEYLNAVLDYLEGGQVHLPWPRPSLNDWADGKVQGYAVLPRGKR